MTDRRLIVRSAQYWYNHARYAGTPDERLLYMENALNHTEGLLAYILRERLGMKEITLLDIESLPKPTDLKPYDKLSENDKQRLWEMYCEIVRDDVSSYAESHLRSLSAEELETELKELKAAESD